MLRTKRFWLSVLVVCLGVGWHMIALAIAERTAHTFPSVDDIFLRVLPRLNLFHVGEYAFFLYVFVFAIVFLRYNRKSLPQFLTAGGLFYGIRGLFLLLLPIGAPHDAIPIADRFVLYPYASHAFFPGGHIGIMLLMACFVPYRRVRWAFILYAVLFGFGSLLARAHYTADLLGGALLAFAAYTIVEKLFMNQRHGN